MDMRQDRLFADLQRFLEDHMGKEFILYYGANQTRRGYEWILRLASEYPDTIFIHCGRLYEGQNMSETARRYRSLLLDQRRIFEAKAFITDRRITESAYAACNYVLLPYQNHYGSSGVMLKSASYGKPVLVPRSGLMGYWVKNHRFGKTFIDGSYKDFLAKWSDLRKSYAVYQEPARRFARMFDSKHVYESLDFGMAQLVVNG